MNDRTLIQHLYELMQEVMPQAAGLVFQDYYKLNNALAAAARYLGASTMTEAEQYLASASIIRENLDLAIERLKTLYDLLGVRDQGSAVARIAFLNDAVTAYLASQRDATTAGLNPLGGRIAGAVKADCRACAGNEFLAEEPGPCRYCHGTGKER